MRLFLSSYRAGNYEDRLTELLGQDNEVAVIMNAKDHKSPDERDKSVSEVLDFFSKLALKPVEVDLRKFFERPEDLANTVRKYNAIWAAGGNTFILRRALAYSGGDKLLSEMVRDNEIIYGGESAGAMMATPNFIGVEFGDDPAIIPQGYKSEVIRDGLGFVPYSIVPHYQSEWIGADAMITAIKKEGQEYKTLTNDQAILVDGDKEEFLE